MHFSSKYITSDKLFIFQKILLVVGILDLTVFSWHLSEEMILSQMRGTGVFLGASLVAQTGKKPTQETRVASLGWEDSPGEENGNPLQSSCLETFTDRGFSLN